MDKKDALIKQLFEKIAQLEKVIEEQALLIAQQAEKIAELERRLNKDSQNSSKPPSLDGYQKKRKNSREKSGKKTGGQTGHKGNTLLQTTPDEVVLLSVSHCAICGKDLSTQSCESIEKRQVHDIPRVRIQVTEYQGEKKSCSCGHVSMVVFPSEAGFAVQYGPRIKGLALYLHNEQKIPYERCCTFLNRYYGARLCEGSLFNTQKAAYEALEKIESQIKEELLKKDVLNLDETGLHITRTLHWFHVVSDEEWTFYGVHEKRGKKAMDAQEILPNYRGVSVHDHWKSYYRYTEMQHALCNAHHLRELKSFEEENQAWATEMRIFLQTLCHRVNEAKREGLPGLSAPELEKISMNYQAIIKRGEEELPLALAAPPGKRGRPKQPKGRNLLHRLRDYAQDVLRFTTDFRVPFTNNQAERDIRMVKLKQKISGGFRSLIGADMFARICGYISTLHKQNIDIADAMTALAKGQPTFPHFS